jgi:ribosome-associated toxin RatA of RatAB toxin-antitoxin module
MADRASSSITVQAAPDAVMAVIADFEAYPEWTSQVKTVEVLRRDDTGRAIEVRFVIDAGIVKDEYTLAYDWSRPDELSWRLVKGQMQKAQDGTYALTAVGGSTEVRYDLTVDLAIPMIGLFKRKAEKTIIDTALKGLKARVERR